MRIGVLGTGSVGRTLATRLAGLGHDVMMGGRTAEGGTAWLAESGAAGRAGTYAETADHGEMAILAVRGDAAQPVVAGIADRLAGKVLIDVTNPLDFSRGFPPRLMDGLHNDRSLGEALQALAPRARVVKALNTMSHRVMVAPDALDGPTDVFLAGEDAGAKQAVAALLRGFGWAAPVDLGGIAAARGLEAWLLLWTRAMGPMGGDGMFNLRLVRTTPR